MSDVAIRVEHLSKLYRLGKRQERYATLRDTIADAFTAPWRWLRNGRNGSSSEPETIWALKDVSFEVKHGEVVGIIGRNGAGKSTLLKILSRITEPTEGRVEIHGRVASLLEVGTGFHPELTGRENIYLNGAILGMRKAEIDRKFDEIVDFAEIERFIDTPVKRYSSGMYVRLAFAVAAHLEPEILLVDEVLAVGDAAFQKKCLGKMGDVAKAGRTVLFVSHNMAAIRKLCHRAFYLEEGRLARKGPAADVALHYLGGDDFKGGSLLQSFRIYGNEVKLDACEINGSADGVVRLAPGSRVLEIRIRGQASRRLRLDLQVSFSDELGTPLAWFDPAKRRGSPHRVGPGPFELTACVQLPRLNQGRLLMSMSLTDPGFAVWAHAQKAAVVTAEGDHAQEIPPAPMHHVGWVLLEGESSVAASSPVFLHSAG